MLQPRAWAREVGRIEQRILVLVIRSEKGESEALRSRLIKINKPLANQAHPRVVKDGSGFQKQEPFQ